jgi:hypothetical protein
MYNELSKSQKKVARMLIDKCLEIECGNCIENIKSLLSNKKGAKTNHELYLATCKLINKFDRHVSKRYDDLGVSKYLITVLELYMDGILSEEDLVDFDEDIRNRLIGLKTHLKQ